MWPWLGGRENRRPIYCSGRKSDQTADSSQLRRQVELLSSPWQCMPARSLQLCQLFMTLSIVAHQAPLSGTFSRPEYLSGLPCSSPGDLPDPGIEPTSLMSPALANGFFNTSTTHLGSAALSEGVGNKLCCFYFLLLAKCYKEGISSG